MKFISRLMSVIILNILLSVILLMNAGCSSNLAKGGGIGATIGGTIGAIIGKQHEKTVEGAIAGAAIGGTAGALIGKYMDKQAEEIKNKVDGVEVIRAEEGIKLVFDSGILFDFDSANLQSHAKSNIQKLSEILSEYQKTNIIIEGHTDSQGSDEYNLELSRERAKAVANYLSNQGVASERFTTVGYGESKPVASNDTESGRQQNRRVEIGVVASEELLEDAEDGTI